MRGENAGIEREIVRKKEKDAEEKGGRHGGPHSDSDETTHTINSGG